MVKLPSIHPGEILRTEFLDPLGITPYALARDTGIDKGNLSRILNGKSSITAETALRLGRFFGTGPESWLNLQAHYDLEVARLSLIHISEPTRQLMSSRMPSSA